MQFYVYLPHCLETFQFSLFPRFSASSNTGNLKNIQVFTWFSKSNFHHEFRICRRKSKNYYEIFLGRVFHRNLQLLCFLYFLSVFFISQIFSFLKYWKFKKFAKYPGLDMIFQENGKIPKTSNFHHEFAGGNSKIITKFF